MLFQVIVLQGLIEVLNLTEEDLGVGKLQLGEIDKAFKKAIWNRVIK
jgi:hypothetical protein